MCVPQRSTAVCKQVLRTTGCAWSVFLESTCDHAAVVMCLAWTRRTRPLFSWLGQKGDVQQTYKQGINTIIRDGERRGGINSRQAQVSERNSCVLMVGEDVFIGQSGKGICKELDADG